MNIAFVSDGRPPQAAGIAAVLTGYLEVGPRPTQVVIARPRQHASAISDWLAPLRNDLNISIVDVSIDQEDRYRIQMALASVLAGFGKEPVIALDYDHMVLHTPPAIEVQPGAIQASSECHPIASLTGWAMEHDLRFGRAPPHYNTSLLISTGETLAALERDWERAYVDLIPWIAVRYRVEVAFSIAVERAGMTCERVSPETQASFADLDADCAWFHYGGEYPGAKRLKAILHDHASLTHGRLPEGVRALRANLTSALSDERTRSKKR